MTNFSDNDSLSRYKILFQSGKYEEAAQLADTFLWKLYVEGQEELVKEILMNTLRTAKSSDTISSSWLYLADVIYREGLYDQAKACYLLGLNAEPNKTSVRVRLLAGIGNTYYMGGDYLTAQGYYSESLEISRALNFIPGISEDLIQLSETSRLLGKYEEAESYGKAALEINVQANRNNGVERATQSLCNLIKHLNAVGETEKVEEIVQFCTSVLQASGFSHNLDIVQLTVSMLTRN